MAQPHLRWAVLLALAATLVVGPPAGAPVAMALLLRRGKGRIAKVGPSSSKGDAVVAFPQEVKPEDYLCHPRDSPEGCLSTQLGQRAAGCWLHTLNACTTYKKWFRARGRAFRVNNAYLRSVDAEIDRTNDGPSTDGEVLYACDAVWTVQCRPKPEYEPVLKCELDAGKIGPEAALKREKLCVEYPDLAPSAREEPPGEAWPPTEAEIANEKVAKLKIKLEKTQTELNTTREEKEWVDGELEDCDERVRSCKGGFAKELARLKKLTSGCPSATTRLECGGSRDGRPQLASPCCWRRKAFSSGNRCEPKEWVTAKEEKADFCAGSKRNDKPGKNGTRRDQYLRDDMNELNRLQGLARASERDLRGVLDHLEADVERRPDLGSWRSRGGDGSGGASDKMAGDDGALPALKPAPAAGESEANAGGGGVAGKSTAAGPAGSTAQPAPPPPPMGSSGAWVPGQGWPQGGGA